MVKYVITLILVLASYSANACTIKHVGEFSEKDTRHYYPLALLKHILYITEAEFGKCELEAVGEANQARQIAWLKANGPIDIAWLPVTDTLNQNLNAIPIPIRKGFLGWRLLLVKKDELDVFADINTLADFEPYTLGFGATWGDLPVMQHNFTNVITSVSYDSLFEMLKRDRFDFLSRAVYEAYDELLVRKDLLDTVVIEPHLALRYRQADFFYVKKDDKALQERIKKGFKKAIRNGSFNVLFYGYYADYIEKSNMDKRTIIELENPYLPQNVPVDDPELWFQLEVYDRLKKQAIKGRVNDIDVGVDISRNEVDER